MIIGKDIVNLGNIDGEVERLLMEKWGIYQFKVL